MLTETNILNAYAFCKDDISLIENYDIAINDNKRYVCHHKNGILLNKSKTELKEIGLYYNRPANELVFMSVSEHVSLHRTGTRNPMYDVHIYGEKHPMYAKHHTDETIQKMSDIKKGKNNPVAKQCTINGITYGCLKDAYKTIKPNYTYMTFTNKYKKGELQ